MQDSLKTGLVWKISKRNISGKIIFKPAGKPRPDTNTKTNHKIQSKSRFWIVTHLPHENKRTSEIYKDFKSVTLLFFYALLTATIAGKNISGRKE